jgi:hypothetical protein
MVKRITCLVVGLTLGALAMRAEAQTLGFTIDPTQGRPGDTVDGQVNPADIAAGCTTTIEEFQNRFIALFTGPFVSSGTEGELPQIFFPDPNDIVYENADQMAYVLTLLAVLGIAQDINGATANAFPQTFVMAFVDLATQRPIGQRGSFDPTTGVGSVVVPDLPPGPHPIAATCVGPLMDIPAIANGIRASGDFLESIGVQFGPDGPTSPEFQAFAQAFLGSDAEGFDLLIEFVTAVGPDLLVPILAPDAIGIQSFTVLPPLVSHFQCYDLANVPFPRRSVTLSDVFGTRTADVSRPADFCLPADKNGEDPDAPSNPAALASYRLQRTGKFTRITGQQVTNQFGTLSLDVRAPRSLLAPSAYAFDAPPSSLDGAFLDHFTCYDVRVTNRTPKFQSRTVSVTTGLETVDVVVRKPRRLCVPTNKNGEDPAAPTHPQGLLCYQTKTRGKASSRLFFDDQFGAQASNMRQRTDFCVPSTLGGSPSGAFL